jgi:hypothetical protein
MPRPLPTPIRQAIWQRHQRGQNVMTIAHALRLAPRTVRHLVRRFQHQGNAALAPSYRYGSASSSDIDDEVQQQALALRRQHPTWGAGLIRVILRRQRAEALPSERTVQLPERASARLGSGIYLNAPGGLRMRDHPGHALA